MSSLPLKIIPALKLQEKPKEAPSFGTFFTNYMFEMDYNEQEGWHNACIKPYENFSLSPATIALHYGQTIFEGLKAFEVSNEIILFRPTANLERMNKSAQRMAMPTFDVDFVLAALIELLQLDSDWFYETPGSSIYIRPTMIATQPSINVVASNEYKFYIILSPSAPYLSSSHVSLVTQTQYMRVALKGTGEAKMGGNYGGSLIASQQALQAGFSQVLWLDPIKSKYIEEAGSMNIFLVIDGKLYTPKITGSILQGITRDSIIKLAPLMNLEVVETTISIDEMIKLYDDNRLSEVFSSGTAASVTPINQITHQGYDMHFKENKVALQVAQYLEALKHGQEEDQFNFIIKVKK
ncbi:MAG: branched-chain amino acid aminotransferase [Bacilli bacterium]